MPTFSGFQRQTSFTIGDDSSDSDTEDMLTANKHTQTDMVKREGAECWTSPERPPRPLGQCLAIYKSDVGLV